VHSKDMSLRNVYLTGRFLDAVPEDWLGYPIENHRVENSRESLGGVPVVRHKGLDLPKRLTDR
jgi:hypothetical protein